MPLTKQQAVDKLASMCQADIFPVLNVDILNEIIDENTRSTSWTALLYYSYGSIVQPTVPNGRFYRVIVPGTSGATEPNFPTQGYTGQVVADVGDLLFVDYGPAQEEIYDVRSAARACWIRKAGIVANLTDVEDGENKLNLSKVYEQCIKMSNLFRPIEIY